MMFNYSIFTACLKILAILRRHQPRSLSFLDRTMALTSLHDIIGTLCNDLSETNQPSSYLVYRLNRQLKDTYPDYQAPEFPLYKKLTDSICSQLECWLNGDTTDAVFYKTLDGMEAVLDKKESITRDEFHKLVQEAAELQETLQSDLDDLRIIIDRMDKELEDVSADE